jgi:hypothetical protein
VSEHLKKILYIVIPAAIVIWLLGYEFIWRFSPTLDVTQKLSITDHSGKQLTVFVRQHSNVSVDTIRRTFSDMRNGKTSCAIWLEGSADTIHTDATGRYFSEFRMLRIAIDSSSQLMLVPNSEHDLPTGWGLMLYLTPGDTVKSLQIINANIADMNHDGTFELFDKTQGTWTKFNPLDEKWVPVTVQPRPN